MPRKYIVIDEKTGETKIKTADDPYQKAEGLILGNTDFDAIYNPITAFNFVLEVEGVYFLPLKTVRAFTKENEYEYIREGGVNDYVHLKRKPISKPFTFQVERYIGTERFLDPLANGCELILPVILYVYRHRARSGITASAPAYPARIYTFTGCTVMSKEYGELNAEKSGLLVETTTISYRELVVVNNGFQSLSEEKEWDPSDSKMKNEKGPGLKTKYAASYGGDDTSKDTYWYQWDTVDGKTRMSMKSSVTDNINKPMWDGSEGKKTYAVKAKPDEADTTYDIGEVGGKPTRTRKDKSDFNRPQYELSKDGAKEKYATKAYVDQNAASPIYEQEPGADGSKHTKRVDKEEINKPMWSGESGVKPAWSQQSAPDKAGNTYSATTKDGVTTVKRTDSSQFNRPQYELSKDKEKQKYSEVAPIDKNAGSPIYKKEGGSIVRKDKAEVNKPPYELHKDMQKPKYAAKSPKDSEKPEAKDPYEFSEDAVEPKWAAKSPMDSEKPEVKEPYKYDDVEPKWAAKSPKDSEKPEAVTWPPTRRALMADQLKK